MSFVCPLRDRSNRPVSISQMRTRRSTPPLARVSPSGAMATDHTPWEWPRNVRISRASAFQYSRQSTGCGAGPGPAELAEGDGAIGVVVAGSAMVNLPSDETDNLPAHAPALLQNGGRGQYNFATVSRDPKRCSVVKSSRRWVRFRRSARRLSKSSTPR
jgi:hypothetical protein